MADLTNIFNGSFLPPREEIKKSPLDQLIDLMINNGMTPPDNIIMDGQIHRFSTNGKSGDDAGWYVIFDDGVPAGRFGCWRDNVEVTFKADMGRQLSAIEQMAVTKRISEAKQRREDEQKRKHQNAAATVEHIWQNASAASDQHPYLVKKGVASHGCRITGDGRLMLPIYDENGELCSLQYISADGDKKYHLGGKTKGGHWHIGSKTEVIYIAEGYATASSIHEATGQMVIISFSSGQMPTAAKSTRERYGNQQQIVVIADNDESGTGQKAAREAADAIGARLVIPPITGDANDYAQGGGNLLELLSPKVDEWLVSADDFSQQPAPLKWLVKGWLQDNALIMVHGPSGGGKTFVVLDWCHRIASGIAEWSGCKVKPGKVIYLAGEGHHGLRSRIAGWKHQHSVNKLDMWLSKAGCDLNTAEGYTRVVDSITALGSKPDVIVVDTLHRFLSGDENSSSDAKTMLDACAGLMRQFSCSVLLVHHTGVSDEAQHRARGSSAWRGALDIEISVVPAKDENPMQIVQRKSKDAEQAQTVYGELKQVEIPGWFDEDGEPVTTAVFSQTDAPANNTENKKESKLSANIKILNRAWWKAGAETDEKGRPYIARSVLREMLSEDGWTDSKIKINLLPSQPERLIGSLVNGEILSSNSHGWSIICNATASQWLMQK